MVMGKPPSSSIPASSSRPAEMTPCFARGNALSSPSTNGVAARSTLMMTTLSSPFTRSPVVSASGVWMVTYSVSIAPSIIS